MSPLLKGGEGTLGLSSVTCPNSVRPGFGARLLPGLRRQRSAQRAAGSADGRVRDTPAACQRRTDAWRGATSAPYALPRGQVSSLLFEVSDPACEPGARSPDPGVRSPARGGTGRGALPPGPACGCGREGRGGPGEGGGPRGGSRGQVDGRAGTAQLPPYDSFPSHPPSQGGGWRRDGPGRAPAGRRRHLLPHRLPGLLGERAARLLPGLPALGARTERGYEFA